MVLDTDAYPLAADVYRGFTDESDYRDWLEEQFARFGWSTWTEVQSRDRKARADLVIRKEPWGSIGIEVKYKDKLTPRYWAKALKQITDYENKSFGLDIDNWAVAGDQSNLGERRRHAFMRDLEVYKQFYNYLGYGFVRTETQFTIVFNNSNPLVKIPIANIDYERGELETPTVQTYERYQTEQAVEYVKCRAGGGLV